MHIAEERALVRRRALLVAALAGSVAGLTGCGIRMATDAPHVPGIKKKGPPADQAALRKLWKHLDTTIQVAELDPSAWGKKLARLHKDQRARLTAVMATQGMTPPEHRIIPTGPTVHLGGLSSLEQAGARQTGSYVTLSARNLPMAAAISVSENAGAQLLGHGIRLTGGRMPKPAVVEAILPSLRAAVYAFEVIIAKTPLHARKGAEATLTMLHAARATWEASLGAKVPAAPDGFKLPVNPTTDATRRQLAQRVLTDLIDACAGQATATRVSPGALIGLTTLWADATAQLWRWGAKPTPFPGLVS